MTRPHPDSQEGLCRASRSCPLCGSTDDSNVYADENFDESRLDGHSFASRKLPEFMHYRLVACPGCDLLYANPIPQIPSLATAYENASFDSAEEACWAARTYARFMDTKRLWPTERGRTLDIGTGDGAFLTELLNRGYADVAGVEPSRAPIQAASPKVRSLILHDQFRVGLAEDGSLALVTCFQTLEHLPDPMGVCREVFRILREGGAFVAVCHDRRSLCARVMGKGSPILDVEHLQLFSPTSARYMMEQAGFVEVKTDALRNTYPLHYWVKLLPLWVPLKKAAMRLLKATGLGYLPLPLPAGNMVISGRRLPTYA